jgi:hypothetical protein
MFGIPTGDFNPIYNVPMLGTHMAAVATASPLSFDLLREGDYFTTSL